MKKGVSSFRDPSIFYIINKLQIFSFGISLALSFVVMCVKILTERSVCATLIAADDGEC